MPEVIPALSGVLETSLYVHDVGRVSEFYTGLFGFEIMIQDQRFCALSVAAKQVLLLFQKGSSTSVTVVPGGNIPPHDGAGELHLAFSVPADALPAWEARLAAQDGVRFPGNAVDSGNRPGPPRSRDPAFRVQELQSGVRAVP